MLRDDEQARNKRLTTGMWLAGIGLMLLNDRIWPDLLFLVGSVRLVESYQSPARRDSRRVGLVLILLGFLIACRLGLIEILILLGAGLTLARLLDRPAGRKAAMELRLE